MELPIIENYYFTLMHSSEGRSLILHRDDEACHMDVNLTIKDGKVFFSGDFFAPVPDSLRAVVPEEMQMYHVHEDFDPAPVGGAVSILMGIAYPNWLWAVGGVKVIADMAWRDFLVNYRASIEQAEAYIAQQSGEAAPTPQEIAEIEQMAEFGLANDPLPEITPLVNPPDMKAVERALREAQGWPDPEQVIDHRGSSEYDPYARGNKTWET
jgi:hypothetical protein